MTFVPKLHVESPNAISLHYRQFALSSIENKILNKFELKHKKNNSAMTRLCMKKVLMVHFEYMGQLLHPAK